MIRRPLRLRAAATLPALATVLAGALALPGCGGGGDSEAAAPPPPPLSGRVASAGGSPVSTGCTGGRNVGTLYTEAEVEPFVAAHPTQPGVLLAAWQQDRWSNGGARAVVSAVSRDGGATWVRTLHPFSRCGNAPAGSAGDFERASDPWVDIGPDGTLHAMALAFSGATLQAGSVSAMLASRSTDGGLSWSAPATLVRDPGPAVFHDKNTLTADPLDARFVYAVWDRIDGAGNGPALIARSSDGGASWEPARVFYTPRTPDGSGSSQTIGHRIVVPTAGPARGTLVNVFVQIDRPAGQPATARVGVVRSTDQGLSWGAPVFVAEHRAVGARDETTGQPIRDGAILPTLAAGPDGTLWVAWQDARFSGGVRDAIALSRSSDGGSTWTAPVAVNRVATTPAFTPTLHVRADGLVALLHFDLRHDTAERSTLPADAWLLTSRDGTTWTETRVGPASFDLALAPMAGGFFLGDYQGLVSQGDALLPVLAATTGSTANRTEVYTPRLDGVAGALSHNARAAVPLLDVAARRTLLQAHDAALRRALAQRLKGRDPGVAP